MIITDPTLAKDLKAGVCNPKELSRYLLNNYPATQLAEALAQELIESHVAKPIVLTEQEFNSHFRIRGLRLVDGKWEKEPRGQYSKKDTTL